MDARCSRQDLDHASSSGYAFPNTATFMELVMATHQLYVSTFGFRMFQVVFRHPAA